MKRLLLMLFTISIITFTGTIHAQKPENPLYLECGAEDYLRQRQNITQSRNDQVNAARATSTDLDFVNAVYTIELDTLRQYIALGDDIPDCARVMYDLLLDRSFLDIHQLYLELSGTFPDGAQYALQEEPVI